MSLEVFREGDNVVVLLCDAYRNVALMEDSGCTAKVDNNYMGTSPPPVPLPLPLLNCVNNAFSPLKRYPAGRRVRVMTNLRFQ